MTAQPIYYGLPRAPFPGINQSALQEMPIVCDVYDAMANNDTAVLTLPAIGDLGMPPRLIQVYRHTGGDITSGAGTFNVNNGSQITFQIDPNSKADTQGRGQVSITTTLGGLTNGSATSVQVAASINADPNLQPYIRAVSGLTANAVSLFPVLSNSTLLKSTNVTAAQQLAALEGSQFPRFSVTAADPAFAFPAGFFGYATRTYVSQTLGLAGVTGFSYSYVASTRAFTLVNTTGGTINRVAALVWQ